MEFVILGRTALHIGGQPVDLGPAKQRGLLALLLYHANEPVHTDTIIEQLWNHTPAIDHRPNLYALVSRIRTVLCRAGMTNPLVRLPNSGTYRLDVDTALVDYHRFRRMVHEARAAANQQCHHTAAALLLDALGLWQDQPLAELRGDQADTLRHQMHRCRLDAHILLATSQLHLGQHESVLIHLEPLLHEHDIDERLAQNWIDALSASGRSGEARAYYLRFRRHFKHELRMEPNICLPQTICMIHPGQPTSSVVAPAHPSLEPPHQLPNDIPDFTGHSQLLAVLDELTNASTNVVVISGMPGVGKTTLTAHWAHRHAHRFPDGQLYLNTNAYGPATPIDPEEALGRFLHALGLPADRIPSGGDQRLTRLNQILTGRRVLIVLDNVRDSHQARRLIPAAATCVTLITSRTRLRDLTIREGIRHIAVPPLDDHNGRALLRHIIGPSRADTEPAAVHALVRLSAGLPLALRIVGEHIAERPRATLTDLAEELETTLLDPTGGDDEDTDLHSVFAWSYDALLPPAAHLFRALGLFPGSSMSPGAAAAMLSISPQRAEQLLNTLAKAYLVTHDTARRYRLHDLLHRFARDRAVHTESPEQQRHTHRRMLDWYLLTATNAAALLTPHRPPVPDLPITTDVSPQRFEADLEAMKWCEAERENLAAVTRWAAANGFPRYAWQLPGAIHEVFGRYGRQDDVLELHELALAAARTDEHQVGQIGTLNNLGVTYFAVHRHADAAAIFTTGLQFARTAHYAEAEASCSYNLASVHLTTGHIDAAIDIYQDVLAAWQKTDDQVGEASVHHQLGAAYRRLGQYERAISAYQQALAIRERIGALRSQGATHGELAALYLEIGQQNLALHHAMTALDLQQRAKDDAARCDTLITAADTHRSLANYELAIAHAHQAIGVSDEIGDSQRRCRALAVLADTLAASGDTDAARQACIQALGIVGEISDPGLCPIQDRLMVIAASLDDPHSVPDLTDTEAPPGSLGGISPDGPPHGGQRPRPSQGVWPV